MDGKRVAVITGGSSGIGKAASALFSANGYTVYELSRRASGESTINHIKADVTKPETLREAFGEIIAREGRIDCLVTCAGMGVSGAVEFITDEETRRQFDVNLIGTINTVRCVIPYMRKARSGHIICVSSVAAEYSIPFQVYYSASKAAINSFVCGLANELRAFGVSVCAIMPGDIKTGFTDARSKIHEGDDVYGGRISRSVAVMENDERSGMAPEAVAAFIYSKAQKKRVSPLYTPGVGYKVLVFLKRLLPSAAVNALIGKLYIK